MSRNFVKFLTSQTHFSNDNAYILSLQNQWPLFWLDVIDVRPCVIYFYFVRLYVGKNEVKKLLVH